MQCAAVLEVGYHLGIFREGIDTTREHTIYVYIYFYWQPATTYNTVRRRINSGLHILVTICHFDINVLIFFTKVQFPMAQMHFLHILRYQETGEAGEVNELSELEGAVQAKVDAPGCFGSESAEGSDHQVFQVMYR